MAPPQLARDAPGLDILHPVEIGLLPVLGDEFGLAVAHGGNRRFRQFLGVHVPLVGEIRLDHDIGAVAVRDDVRVRLDFLNQPHFLQTRDDRLARSEAIGAVQRERRIEVGRLRHARDEVRIILQLKLSLDAEDIDLRQVVPLADLEIAEVVRRCNLHGTRTLLRVGNLVADNRNLAPNQRQDCIGPDQRLVAIVVRVHRNGGVAQHSFRSRRGDNDVGRPIVRLERLAF